MRVKLIKEKKRDRDERKKREKAERKENAKMKVEKMFKVEKPVKAECRRKWIWQANQNCFKFWLALWRKTSRLFLLSTDTPSHLWPRIRR